jgi:glycosyltransferase involved in cell wall biosynthesis
LEGKVILAGGAPPKRVAEWLAASDVLALPSYSEGCPNVVIEALACGRPVVATTVGATPDLVTPDCGILVRAGNTAALSAALREALERAWDHQRIAASHRRSWSEAARETFEVCLGVVQKARERQERFG